MAYRIHKKSPNVPSAIFVFSEIYQGLTVILICYWHTPNMKEYSIHTVRRRFYFLLCVLFFFLEMIFFKASFSHNA